MESQGRTLFGAEKAESRCDLCFRKISLTVLLVQATFSLEEREKDLLGSHLYSYQVW